MHSFSVLKQAGFQIHALLRHRPVLIGLQPFRDLFLVFRTLLLYWGGICYKKIYRRRLSRNVIVELLSLSILLSTPAMHFS